MFIRKSILSLALLGAMASPVFATSGTTPNNGELGATTHTMPTTVTRFATDFAPTATDWVFAPFSQFALNFLAGNGGRHSVSASSQLTVVLSRAAGCEDRACHGAQQRERENRFANEHDELQ